MCAAKVEVNKIDNGWVYVVEQDPILAARQGNLVAALPSTWRKGEIFIYYTKGQDDSIVQVTPDDEGKGCLANSTKLKVGESLVIGNLKITGA